MEKSTRNAEARLDEGWGGDLLITYNKFLYKKGGYNTKGRKPIFLGCNSKHCTRYLIEKDVFYRTI